MTDQRRMPSTDLHDLVDEMSRRSGGSAPPEVTDDPFPEDPWAEDEPVSTPDATPQRSDQPTVVGHVFAASMQLAAPRGSNHRIAGPTAPTPAHARAAAVLGAPMIRSSPGRSPSIPAPARLATASTLRIKSMPEVAARTGRSPTGGSSPRIERDPRMATLAQPASTERPAVPPPSRLSAVMLGALVAGGVGAFLVAKATQYATESEASSPAASTIAATRATPPVTPPAALAAVPAAQVRPAALASVAPAQAPDPQTARAATGEPAVATPSRTVAPLDKAVTSPPRNVARPDDTSADRTARPRAHPARATAAVARVRPEPEPQAEVARTEPRADDRPADIARAEPARVEPPAVEAPPVKAADREPAPVPAPVARPDPRAPPSGAIDIAAVRAAVRAQIAPVQQCYERARMDDASLAGTVLARITIGLDGSVANIDIVRSTLGAPQVEACIRQSILRWHLPRPSGGAASLTYPLVFQ